jgi:drug/metabolite transporter (DMT)-like permease
MPGAAASSRTRHRTGIALVALSAAGFGTLAILAKEAYATGIGTTSLLALRFALAAAVFWALVLWRRSARPPRRTVLAGLALGAFGYAAQAGFFFSALRYIDASLTSLLLYTYPVLVFGAAVALKREQPSRRTAGALVLAGAGTALVLLGGGTGALDGLGVALALGSAVAYCAYILVSDVVLQRADPFLLAALVATGATVTFTLAGLASGSLAPGAGGAQGLVLAAAIALVATVLPITAFFAGMQRVGPSTASIVSTFEPAVTVALAVVVLGEGFGPLQLVGGVLVLAAIVVLQRRARGARAGADAASVRADDAAAPVAAAAAPARPLAREPA